MRGPRASALCIALFLLVALAGCTVSDRWVYEDSEGVVADEFFEQIRKNQTEQSWIVAKLGKPKTMSMDASNYEFATYSFKRVHYQSTSLLLVLRYTGSEHDIQYYHLMYCDGVLKKHWWDKLAEIDTKKRAGDTSCGNVDDAVVADSESA